MSKFEKLKELFNCKVCSKLLHEPVLLPCGKTVCKIHTQEIANKECNFCTKLHQITKDGFPSNELIENFKSSCSIFDFYRPDCGPIAFLVQPEI